MATRNELEKFVERLNEWRRGRNRPGALPAELWAEAAEVARSFGIGATARAAGLNYGRVKAHSLQASPSANKRGQKRLTTRGPLSQDGRRFVQVPLSLASPSDVAAAGPIVEIRSATGESMRLREWSAQDAALLVNAFLGRRRT
jgi:hypothetical protein